MTHNLNIWLAAYMRQALAPTPLADATHALTLHLAVADHFEPLGGGADQKTAYRRLATWEKHLPLLCREIGDSFGRPPQHTFFYPLEDYQPKVLDRLSALCVRGLGDVEVHLHHEGETSAQLEDKLASYAEKLHLRHGLLRRDPATGKIVYGFVHGNWALDNSLPGGRWCGVNDELKVLARSGCYADFTLPAAPSPAQTRTINAIYYATDDPQRPKSHDYGREVAVGLPPAGDLLIVQGILALNWQKRKWGFLPRIENSDLGAHRPPEPGRIPLWLRFAPRVRGAENHLFIKLSCHGAPERHFDALLGNTARRFLEHLATNYTKGRYRLKFVTCWEMVQAVHALEKGEEPK